MEIKIWQTTKIHMAAIGFAPNQQHNNSNWPCSSVQLVNVVICSINAISIGIYILREANVVEDFIESIFAFTAIVGVLVSFISIILNNDKAFNNIELCENELAERE